MTLVLDAPIDLDEQFEAMIDLENGTWVCLDHGTVQLIAGGHECPVCIGNQDVHVLVDS